MGRKEQEKKPEKQSPSNKMKKLIVIGVVAAIGFGAYYALHLSDQRPNVALIDGIECDRTEYSTFHVHAHLDVFFNGQPYTVPAFIGILDNTCLYWLHTHDTSGIIHIESPQAQQFTLGEFFDIWKSTSTGVPQNGNPAIFVNGQPVNTSISNIPLNPHDEIVLVYGNAPANIPSYYQFPEGL